VKRPGVVLDASAFIGVERRDAVAVRLFHRFLEARTPLVTSAGVVAQVWRTGAGGQVPLALLLRRTEVIDLTNAVARTIGRMMALAGTSDPIDAHVVLLARERTWPVLSSDAGDLLAIDPALAVHPI
jgi:fumarylacetoacetate (FAA) hydrolase family protein